jgi:hypothetical protein
MSKRFNQLCTPAKIYLILSMIGVILTLYEGTTPFISVLINIVFVLLWTYILGWICKKGFNIISWILVLGPLLFVPIVLLMFISKSSS